MAAKYDILDYADTASWNYHNYDYPNEFDQYLASRYHGDSTNGHTGDSLRDLDVHLNALITEASITGSNGVVNQQIVNYRPRDVYEIIDGKQEVEAETEGEVRRLVQSLEVNTEDLLADYTSYRSIQTHLSDHMQIDTSQSPTTRDAAKRTVLSRVSQLEAVTSQMLASLRKNSSLADADEEITLPSDPDDIQVTVDVTAENTQTGDTTDVKALLDWD